MDGLMHTRTVAPFATLSLADSTTTPIPSSPGTALGEDESNPGYTPISEKISAGFIGRSLRAIRTVPAGRRSATATSAVSTITPAAGFSRLGCLNTTFMTGRDESMTCFGLVSRSRWRIDRTRSIYDHTHDHHATIPAPSLIFQCLIN